jgi:hypothetical protein
MTHPWLLLWTLLFPWICTIAIAYMFGRIWWTAVRTGRWLLANGRSYYFPRKYYTFSLYERTSNFFMYRLGLICVPVLFLFFLSVSVLGTIAFAQAHDLI